MSCQAPSHSANRVERVSPEEQKGRAVRGTLQMRYCWEFSTGYTANYITRCGGEGARNHPSFENKISTHSSYLIPRDSPLSVLRVPAPCP